MTCPTSSSSVRASRWLCVQMCLNCYLLYVCNFLLISSEPRWPINASKTLSLQSFEVSLCSEQHVGHPVLGLHLLLLFQHLPPFSPPPGDLLDDILESKLIYHDGTYPIRRCNSQKKHVEDITLRMLMKRRRPRRPTAEWEVIPRTECPGGLASLGNSVRLIWAKSTKPILLILMAEQVFHEVHNKFGQNNLSRFDKAPLVPH